MSWNVMSCHFSYIINILWSTILDVISPRVLNNKIFVNWKQHCYEKLISCKCFMACEAARGQQTTYWLLILPLMLLFHCKVLASVSVNVQSIIMPKNTEIINLLLTLAEYKSQPPGIKGEHTVWLMSVHLRSQSSGNKRENTVWLMSVYLKSQTSGNEGENTVWLMPVYLKRQPSGNKRGNAVWLMSVYLKKPTFGK